MTKQEPKYYSDICNVYFPGPSGYWINMMPIIHGDENSVPRNLVPYVGMFTMRTTLKQGSTVYLSIRESYVRAGDYQSRPGLHTEAIAGGGWGGGNWGSGSFPRHGVGGLEDGVYMASTDGGCLIYDEYRLDGDEMGAIECCNPTTVHQTKPNTLYWLTDRTPHQVMPAEKDGIRQWVRLVSSKVDVWYSQHSTPNPLGVLPDCKIITRSKYT